MPIKVDLVSNSSQIRVKPTDNKDVKVISDAAVIDKVQDAKINKEIAERKAADNLLQIQIDQKQDEIAFITVYELAGIIPSQELAILVKNKVNRLVYQDQIYCLSIEEGNIRKYFTTTPTTEYNEIDVNITNGGYGIKSTIAPEIKEHLEDEDRHIRVGEREAWNNKEYASIELDSDSDSDGLILVFNK